MFKRVIIIIFVASIGFTQQLIAQSLSISRKFINVESAAVSQPSAIDTFSLVMNNFSGDLRMVTSFPFQLSGDGLLFNDTLLIDNNLSNTNVTVYVRFVPNQADIVFREHISFQDDIFTINQKVYLVGTSIAPAQSVSVCSWNMKWFGLPTQCNCDTALSLKNAAALIKEINADVFALQEVVSIDHLQRIVQELGQNFTYVISDYGSQISNNTQLGYANCQKLAYIYNQTKITNEGTFGLLRSTYPAQQGTSSPYYYFASGRWPLVLKAKVINSTTNQSFMLLNIHGKAYATSTDHNRRAGAAVVMADSLNGIFANENILLIGDYNDLLEGAITSGFTVSPYNFLLNNGFKGITLPSLFPGEITYIASPGSLIDNVCVSDQAYPSVIPNATIILREADFSIDNFKSTTSDHLPIITYLRTNTVTRTTDVIKDKLYSLVNPANGLQIKVPNQFKNIHSSIQLTDISGKKLWSKEYIFESQITEEINFLQPGIYLVTIHNEQHAEAHKLFIR